MLSILVSVFLVIASGAVAYRLGYRRGYRRGQESAAYIFANDAGSSKPADQLVVMASKFLKTTRANKPHSVDRESLGQMDRYQRSA